MTKVAFLINKGEQELFAYFPELVADNNGNKTSYTHVGQHSACSDSYARESMAAKHYQYYELLLELVSIGYKDLIVMNNELIKCWRRPTDYEIKFGHGAIHYRDFTLAEIGISKKGWIKSWFRSKDDGLRYNHY
jgi:hypothetical protein